MPRFHSNKLAGLKDNDIDHNLNNLDIVPDDEHSRKICLRVQVQLICLALDVLQNPRGSTLKEIRHSLCVSGLINPNDDLRRAMVKALKTGFVVRPAWAVKSGQFGFYIKGDGVPIHTGRKKKRRRRQMKKEEAGEEVAGKKKDNKTKKSKTKKKQTCYSGYRRSSSCGGYRRRR